MVSLPSSPAFGWVTLRKGKMTKLESSAHYVAGSHLYVEPFVLLGHKYRERGKPTQLGDFAVIRSHSVIYQDVEIGRHFKCGHSVVIRAETKIGDYCVVGNRSVIEGRVSIGEGTRIMSSN